MVKRVILAICCFCILGLSACSLGACNLPQNLVQPQSSIVRAVRFGSLEAVKEAVEGGDDVNTTFLALATGGLPRKMSVYEYIWRDGKAVFPIGEYLYERGADLNFLGSTGSSPLMGAAAHNDVALCEEYLKKGADINLHSTEGWTALDAAAYGDAPDAIMFLISKGAALTPDSLRLAMEHQNYRSANVLAKELKAREIDTGLSPILLAAVTGDSQDVIQRCCAGEFTTDNQTEVGCYTAAFCSAEALDTCVKFGFAMDQEENPVEIAAECGNLEIVQFMMEQYPEAVGKVDAQSALSFAVGRDDVEMTTYLLQANANRSGSLSCAVDQGSLQTLNLLLEISFPRNEMEDALRRAADLDRLDCMKALLSAGEWRMYALNSAWNTARSVEARELLVSHGAKPTDLDFRLSLAVENGELEMVKYLLSMGADPDVIQEDGSYALHFAVLYGYYDIAELLIKHGADVNYTDPANADCTVLHTAAMSSTNLTRLLAEHGADVNAQTTQGYTPLMYAVESGKPATVEVLLWAGADARIQNEDGKTAEDLAEELGDEALRVCFS